MIRKVTKMSTVTPKSTLTKSKSIGQGVKNIGNATSKGPVSMAMGKKAAKEGSMEAASSLPQLAMKSERRPKAESMMMGAMAGAAMPKIGRKAVKTGTKVPKPKAKMLPEVTVTAPKPKKRLALKVTSKRMR